MTRRARLRLKIRKSAWRQRRQTRNRTNRTARRAALQEGKP